MVLVAATPHPDDGPLAVDLPEAVPQTLVGARAFSSLGFGYAGSPSDGSGFYVEDEGFEVPPGRERVFEGGYSTDEMGRFGLAAVRRIAEAHG